ncbi:MAG TPA: peptide-methionine (S)-S-oxide reductase MsrA [Candidatus Paceibacterota bacterium]|nr:peptide-methionine (S)-S-oxide reductase MsrA [Candidatus Paceibacterota bacterium]
MGTKTEVAVFGGGCFWCTEAVFEELRGVISVMPGYTGGTVPNPSYDAVCTGETGHAEATRIEFDPLQVTYRDLLTVFFATHDPTTLNRQGNDVGTQYRSAIFYSTPAQEAEAEKFIAELTASDPKGRPIVTEVVPLGEFYDAEDYHRHYFKNHPNAGYCQVIIEPKVEKLQKQFVNLLKEKSK